MNECDKCTQCLLRLGTRSTKWGTLIRGIVDTLYFASHDMRLVALRYTKLVPGFLAVRHGNKQFRLPLKGAPLHTGHYCGEASKRESNV